MTADPGLRLEAEDSEGPRRELSREVEAQLARWHALVRRVTIRFGFAEAEVDELEQDVRIRVWRALERGRENRRGVASSYAYEAVMCAAVDLLRRRRRQQARIPLEGVEEEAAAHATIASGSTEADLLAALDRALAAVPVSRRAAVRLHLEGKGLEEIGRLMQWTPGKARNLLYRGLSDLREVLERLGHS